MKKVTKEQYEFMLKDAKTQKQKDDIEAKFFYEEEEEKPELVTSGIKEEMPLLDVADLHRKILMGIERWFAYNRVMTKENYYYVVEVVQNAINEAEK